MKILFLVDDIKKISNILRQDTNIKVIDEYEISQDTPYQYGMVQPGYSEYILNRTATLSKVYKSQKTLCIVLDQSHSNPLNKIQHDISIIVCKEITPKRLSYCFRKDVNKTIIEDNFNLSSLYEFSNQNSDELQI